MTGSVLLAPRSSLLASLLLASLLPCFPATAAFAQESPNRTLTAVPGLKLGHHTLKERPTGCTVVLAEGGAVGGVDVRGGAPGTTETDLLDPVNTVDVVHAVVLSGGSAFGLDAASGVRRWLEARGVGYKTEFARVPIVPGAILYDLAVGEAKVRPTAECGAAAAEAASAGQVAEGSVGAGAGATVGKLLGPGRAMKGGVGSAAVQVGAHVVAALAVVNAYGDVIDPATGRVVAGVRTADGRRLADARVVLRSGQPLAGGAARNTTLVVVGTNASLTKAQATKLAQMAGDGLARAIAPAHTPFDGDTVFALATGTAKAAVTPRELTVLGALAAEVTAEAIVRGAREAAGLPGLPAARDVSR